MRRTVRTMVTMAMIAGVIGVGGAGAGPSGACDPGRSDYALYCHRGDHWRASALPLRLKLNNTGAPTTLRSAQVAAAAAGASLEWERHWPLPTPAGSCAGAVARAVCVDGITTAGFGRDGVNTILWGDPAVCGAAGAAAVACLWYEQADGPSGKRIEQVDIILNPALVWRQPRIADVGAADHQQQAMDEATGLVRGSTIPQGCGLAVVGGSCWTDLQSTLTHEIGHALGLEHVGNRTTAFPEVVGNGEAVKYQLTMYRWGYSSTTNKRTLEHGDVLALQHTATDTVRDM